jgi:hypothetical protein
MDSALKIEIIQAIQNNRTNNPEIAYAVNLYSLLQLGATLNIDDLDSRTAKMLLYIGKEIQHKIDRESRLSRMK